MPAFTANADYEEKAPGLQPLRPGAEITAGPADRTWPGWIWAVGSAGFAGYLPEQILRPLDSGRFTVSETFDPTVLTIRRGDPLESLRQIHGWHWCRNTAGQEGWVAGYLLRPKP